MPGPISLFERPVVTGVWSEVSVLQMNSPLRANSDATTENQEGGGVGRCRVRFRGGLVLGR